NRARWNRRGEIEARYALGECWHTRFLGSLMIRLNGRIRFFVAPFGHVNRRIIATRAAASSDSGGMQPETSP
ncbi:MAG: hypothetical protein ACM3ZE_04365, partial [Myxococcales bacterium]